jgi:hypothetical protein
MRMKKEVWVVLACVIGLSFAGSFDWAPAGASRLGQTVPTRTPTAATETPTSEPSPTPEPSPVSTVPSIEPSPAATPVFLPTAGDSAAGGLQFMGVIGLGLTLLAWAIRRRVRGNTR